MDTGEVTSIVGDQVVVKPTSQLPQMGAAIYTAKGKIGIVADVIGTVDKPYFIVKLQPKAKVTLGERTISNQVGG